MSIVSPALGFSNRGKIKTNVASIQAFYGKYMAKWRKDRRSRGLFIALPGLNSHAKGFYNENCDGATDTTIKLLEQGAVIDAVIDADIAVRPDVISKAVPASAGSPGDQVLLYTDHGVIWLQYLLSPGSAIADRYALFTQKGEPVSDIQTIEYVQSCFPSISGFKLTLLADVDSRRQPPDSKVLGGDDSDQIVEVRGSSAWFEYQFPASPEFFVGRSNVLAEVQDFARAVIERSTSARGILFTGNSGWGKSSAVLATSNLLQKMGHFAVVIDCRSISSSKSVLRVVDIALQKLYAQQGD
jgi:hypothetical protein